MKPSAVVDIGSNTVKLIIAEKINGKIKIHIDEKHDVKLSEGLAQNGEIRQDKRQLLNRTLQKFDQQIKSYAVENCQCIATEAVRIAKNRDEVTGIIQQYFSTFTIMEGLDEARWIAKAIVQSGVKEGCIIDIGGGSTEIIILHNGNIQYLDTTPLGSLSIAHQLSLGDQINLEDYKNMQRLINEQLDRFPLLKKPIITGTEGAFSNLYQALNQDEIPNFNIEKMNLENAIQQLKKWTFSTLSERQKDKNLQKEREQIAHIAAGLLLTIMEYWNIEECYASAIGLKEACVLELL